MSAASRICFGALAPIVLIVVVGSAFSASAASSCYDDDAFPTVLEIRPNAAGAQLLLGGAFSAGGVLQPSIQWDRSKGWQSGKPIECPDSYDCSIEAPACAESIEIPLDREEFLKANPAWRSIGDDMELEQKIGACHSVGTSTYFGIRFYSGEGTVGVGGFGVKDGLSGKIEIRRPAKIRPYSIGHVFYDGNALWLGTAAHYECIGSPPAIGLLQYDWEVDLIRTAPTCGAVINDLQVIDGEIWVATELGLSIGGVPGKYGARKWRHYVPNPGSVPSMQETTCDDLYARLLRAEPVMFNGASAYSDSRTQLMATLARLRGDVLARMVLELLETNRGPAMQEKPNSTKTDP